MRGKDALCLGLAAAALLVAAPAATAACPHPDDIATTLAAADQHAALLCAINAERAAHALSAVSRSSQLSRAAQRHGADMVARTFFSHVSPGGATLVDRVRATGYLRDTTTWQLGETIAWAQEPLDTAARITAAWMASPPHRAIILDADFRSVGIGVAPGLTDGSGGAGATIVLDFGARTLRPWRSPTTCARNAKASRRARARCASSSTRSRPSSRAARPS
jgi:uncharacterized protein YkwD